MIEIPRILRQIPRSQDGPPNPKILGQIPSDGIAANYQGGQLHGCVTVSQISNGQRDIFRNGTKIGTRGCSVANRAEPADEYLLTADEVR